MSSHTVSVGCSGSAGTSSQIVLLFYCEDSRNRHVHNRKKKLSLLVNVTIFTVMYLNSICYNNNNNPILSMLTHIFKANA